jgi:hypothetical protein
MGDRESSRGLHDAAHRREIAYRWNSTEKRTGPSTTT